MVNLDKNTWRSLSEAIERDPQNYIGLSEHGDVGFIFKYKNGWRGHVLSKINYTHFFDLNTIKLPEGDLHGAIHR